jgi:hypothetical protein
VLCDTALKGTKILGVSVTNIWRVSKELCYGKAETLEDAEEGTWWWPCNLVL